MCFGCFSMIFNSNIPYACTWEKVLPVLAINIKRGKFALCCED